jgi:hypothetical protein
LDVADLASGVLVEDQGRIQEFVRTPSADDSATPVQYAVLERPREPFFVGTVATKLLENIGKIHPPAPPVSTSIDLPCSEGLLGVFDVAWELREQLQSNKVEPLHLLAAVLTDESDQVAQISQNSGITHEQVMEAIRREAA